MSSLRKVSQLARARDVPGLCRMLRHRDTQARHRAARALGEIGDPAAVPHLANALHTPNDPWLHQWAIGALRTIADRQAIDVLIEAMFSSERQIALQASQALAATHHPRAEAALRLRERIQGVFDVHDLLADQEIGPVLAVIMRSEQFAIWPSARRRAIIEVGLQLGVQPPRAQGRDLAKRGLFISGLDTARDLVSGIWHRRPEVRIAAAGRLAENQQRWSVPLLYRRFQRESTSDAPAAVLAALIRALDQLGDGRGIMAMVGRLHSPEAATASEAARILAAAGTANSFEALFRFALEAMLEPEEGAGPGHATHFPAALAALEAAGSPAIDALVIHIDDPMPRVRLILLDLIRKSTHPQRLELLRRLCLDPFAEVQNEAIRALAQVNTSESAHFIYELLDRVPRARVIEALGLMSDPAAWIYLKELTPEAALITGTALRDMATPMQQSFVQLIESGPAGRALSVRGATDSQGGFRLTVLTPPAGPCMIKIVRPPLTRSDPGEVYTGELTLARGTLHEIEARVDPFFKRLRVSALRHIPLTELDGPVSARR